MSSKRRMKGRNPTLKINPSLCGQRAIAFSGPMIQARAKDEDECALIERHCFFLGHRTLTAARLSNDRLVGSMSPGNDGDFGRPV